MLLTALEPPKSILATELVRALNAPADDDTQQVVVAPAARTRYESVNFNGIQDFKILVDRLDELGVRVFDEAEVHKYKLARLDRLKWRLRLRYAAWALALVASIYTALRVAFSLGFSDGVCALCIGAVVVLVCFSRMMHACIANRESTIEWKRYRYDDYRAKIIPTEVTAVKRRVAARLPLAVFYIDELQLNRRPKDPFLIVHYGTAHLHIAVWDEKFTIA